MTEEAQWQRDLITALYMEKLLATSCAGLWGPADACFLQPSRDESERAVANIRAWRVYLPTECVSRMIEEGWQWST